MLSPVDFERQQDLRAMGVWKIRGYSIFVETPFEECAHRDPKGLCTKALKGEIKNFTGVNLPYEAPANSDIHLQAVGRTAEDSADEIESWLRERGYC